MRLAHKRFIAMLAAIIMLLAWTAPMAFAMTASHEIISTSQQTSPPYSVQPSDEILFEINAEFLTEDEKPDEIDIVTNSSLEFVEVTNYGVYNTNSEPLPWDGIESIGMMDGAMKIMLAPIPETAVRLEITYTCTAGTILTIGPNGMANKASIITHVNNVRENDCTVQEVESRSVYAWGLWLWTIDSNKEYEDVGKNNNSGQDMHPGQSVPNAAFSIYTDPELSHKLTFTESFRRYVVCPESKADHTDIVKLDNAGLVHVGGLTSGTYYIVEERPAKGYASAITDPIQVSFDYDTKSLPEVKLINLYDQASANNKHIEFREGPTIMIDYKENIIKTPKVLPLALTIAGTGVILFIGPMLYTEYTKRKQNNAQNG